MSKLVQIQTLMLLYIYTIYLILYIINHFSIQKCNLKLFYVKEHTVPLGTFCSLATTVEKSPVIDAMSTRRRTAAISIYGDVTDAPFCPLL